MDGTHKRMLEAMEKNIPIHYLCRTMQQLDYLYEKAFRLYSLKPRALSTPKIYREAITPQGALVRFRTLNIRTKEQLRGFSGCVLIHPDTYEVLLNPVYDYAEVQELINTCNTRNQPWLP